MTTRVTDSSATLIDNICTNELRHNLTCGILFDDISDHLLTFAVCEYNIKRTIVKEFQHIRKITEDTLASLSNEERLLTAVETSHEANGKLIVKYVKNITHVMEWGRGRR